MSLKPLRKALVLIIIFCLNFSQLPIAKSAYNLYAPKDIISNTTPDAQAWHNISFGMPTEYEPLDETDYILIQFVYFSNVQIPSGLGGTYEGDPQYQVSGTILRITGISMDPGDFLMIKDVRANNPSMVNAFDVYITIARDYDGTQIKYSSHILATSTDGSVVLRAEVPANIGQLQVSGRAAPGMLVAFTENGAVIGTCDSDTQGDFSLLITGLQPAEHTIMAYGTDSADRYTPNVEIQTYVRAYVITEVTGIIIPPTISIDKETVEQGQDLIVAGYGIPDYTVNIYTEPPLQSFSILLPESGEYMYTISTADMEIGEHKVYSLLQDEEGNTSLFSLELNFTVTDPAANPPSEDPGCNIAEGDLNCDAHVNLTDFSILLYYWGTESGYADVNNDDLVNLIDFSIMMFYWET